MGKKIFEIKNFSMNRTKSRLITIILKQPSKSCKSIPPIPSKRKKRPRRLQAHNGCSQEERTEAEVQLTRSSTFGKEGCKIKKTQRVSRCGAVTRNRYDLRWPPFYPKRATRVRARVCAWQATIPTCFHGRALLFC